MCAALNLLPKPMTTPRVIKTHTIDATGKSLGRVASRISRILQGKNKPEYAPNKDCGDSVVVKNLDAVAWTGRKFDQKKHYKFSGYPGGIRADKVSDAWKQNPSEILRKAVADMLPHTAHRSKYLSRLRVVR